MPSKRDLHSLLSDKIKTWAVEVIKINQQDFLCIHVNREPHCEKPSLSV